MARRDGEADQGRIESTGEAVANRGEGSNILSPFRLII